MKFHVYLCIDRNGDWNAAGASDKPGDEIIIDWNLVSDLGYCNAYRIEIEVPDNVVPSCETLQATTLGKPKLVGERL